jgi:beta-glucosidase
MQLTQKQPDVAPSVEARIQSLLSQMTLAEKIGQMTQVEKNSIQPAEVTEYAIGSVLSGGGGNPSPNNADSWREMVTRFVAASLQTRLAIPLIYGSDAVHGHNNVHGAVIFPHNIGIGATRDVDLVERIARIVAAECAATNVLWDFAPAVSLPQDIRWGRTYEGYGSQPEVASELGAAFVRGLQGAGVLASVKHYLADGGTTWGSKADYAWLPMWRSSGDGTWSIDQGDTRIDEATLRAVHLPPYRAAIEAGALNIMVSYNSWQGVKMHAHRYLLTDVLKGELGFRGFLVSDWLATDQLDTDFYAAVVKAINAGLDMIMVPFDYKRFIQTMKQAVEAGAITEARIDDAVTRILRAKFAIGLFEQPLTDPALLTPFGSPDHREIAREAVRKSLVLLKNTDQVLPLSKSPGRLLVAGQAADDMGLQCGGWTIEWMGKPGAVTPGTTILEGIRATVTPDTEILYSPTAEFDGAARAEVGLLVIGEQPYAEGQGDRNDLGLTAEQHVLIARMKRCCDKLVVILVSGRPLIVTEEVDDWDALVAAWLPGSEGNGVADVLFGDHPFTGKLGHHWPRSMAAIPVQSESDALWAFGFGL